MVFNHVLRQHRYGDQSLHVLELARISVLWVVVVVVVVVAAGVIVVVVMISLA